MKSIFRWLLLWGCDIISVIWRIVRLTILISGGVYMYIEFYDGRGILRRLGEEFCDGRGVIRKP